MLRSEKVRIFMMGFVAAVVLVTVVAAATSNGPGPGRSRIETLDSPYAMIAAGLFALLMAYFFTGRGTGLRYHVNPLSGRKTLRVSGKPCNRPPWGRLWLTTGITAIL